MAIRAQRADVEIAAREALARAAVYEVLSLSFSYPEPEVFDGLRSVLAPARIARGPDLRGPLRDVAAAVEDGELEPYRTEHTRLFSRAAPCPPYETAYDPLPFTADRRLADVLGFYRAFGADLSRRYPDAADALVTECEFMALLCRKEGLAALEDRADRREVTVSAERAFLEAHLGRWAQAFGRKVGAAARPLQGRLLSAASTLLERFVDAEVVSLGARPLPVSEHSGRVSEVDEADTGACGLSPAGGSGRTMREPPAAPRRTPKGSGWVDPAGGRELQE